MAKSLACPCQTIFDGNKVACVFTACWEENNSFIYLFWTWSGHSRDMVLIWRPIKKKGSILITLCNLNCWSSSQIIWALVFLSQSKIFFLSWPAIAPLSLVFDRPVHLSSASIQAALTNPWCSLSLSLYTNLILVTLTSLMLLIFFVLSYLWYGFTVWPKFLYYNFLFFFSTFSLTWLFSIKTSLTPK